MPVRPFGVVMSLPFLYVVILIDTFVAKLVLGNLLKSAFQEIELSLAESSLWFSHSLSF